MLLRYLLTFYFLPVFAKRGSSGQRVHYPTSNGLSGTTFQRSHNYPHSTGLSGTGYGNTPRHITTVHHHYNYAPPQYISYGSTHHPVYHGTPPVYVYEYRNSGSRFDNLLTGLALYNLGRMSANHDYDRHNYYNREYRGSPGELCKMVISKRNGEYEETRIDCRLMSSFIWEAQQTQQEPTNTITKTVNVTQSIVKEGNSTIIVQNTTVVDALQVKGPSIQVTPGMDCYMIRISRDSSKLKRKVDCALLQEYARSSLRYNNCERINAFLAFIFLPLWLCLQ